MDLLKASALPLTLVGGVAAFLGVFVMISALMSGTIRTSFATARGVAADSVAFANDPGHFLALLVCLGLGPAVLGALTSRWAWQQLKANYRQSPPDR